MNGVGDSDISVADSPVSTPKMDAQVALAILERPDGEQRCGQRFTISKIWKCPIL